MDLLEGIGRFDMAHFVLVDPPPLPLPDDPMKLQLFELEALVKAMKSPL